VDGWLGAGSIGNGGQVLQDSVEVDELKHPIRILAQHILPDTEGAGRNRGGPSNYVEYGPVGCELVVMYASDGTVFPPSGARGGLPGSCARQYIRGITGELAQPLPSYGQIVVQPGETVVSMSCGGGGYGSPYERDPERVLHDVMEGWISVARARSVYGVAVTEAGEIDARATKALRDGRAGSRSRTAAEASNEDAPGV
jgi:N-methylhydantoinase B